MYKKLDSRKLLIILVMLVIAVVAVIFFDSRKGERSFRADMVDADTSKITKIVVYTKSDMANGVELSKQGKDWKVRSGKNLYNADPDMISSMLVALNDMKVLRISANDKSKWKEFDVVDSVATRVKVYTGNKIKTDLLIGRFNYQQPKNRNPYDYYNQRGTMSTYIRLEGEKTVYLVDGFLGMTFNRTVNDFRKKTIIRSDKEAWTKLTFSYPSDSSFTITKRDGKWTVNGVIADSVSVANYLGTLSYLNSQDIIDEMKPLSNVPVFTLSIEGNNFAAPIQVKAFPADAINGVLISSTQNEGAWFSGSKNGLADKIFVSDKKFLSQYTTN